MLRKICSFAAGIPLIFLMNITAFAEEIDDASLDALANAGGFSIRISSIVIGLISIVALIFLFVIPMRKDKKKHSFAKELNNYVKDFQGHVYSGNVSLLPDGIGYSRGNRSVVFPITISRETLLSPSMVDEWFEGRNYNAREANMILDDIQYYLTYNKICKTVEIVDDEDLEEESCQEPMSKDTSL